MLLSALRGLLRANLELGRGRHRVGIEIALEELVERFWAGWQCRLAFRKSRSSSEVRALNEAMQHFSSL